MIMANYCSNTVAFEGTTEAIGQVTQLFRTMAEKQQSENKGQLPDFVKDESGYFLDLYWNEGDEDIFQYETRWAPNTEVVMQIAKYYKVNFTLDYEEMGNGVYGKITCKDGIITDTYLEDEDFETYEYDEEEDTYHFEGETYEGDWEILETLLERKIAAL
jgi:hypothetical protein